MRDKSVICFRALLMEKLPEYVFDPDLGKCLMAVPAQPAAAFTHAECETFIGIF